MMIFQRRMRQLDNIYHRLFLLREKLCEDEQEIRNELQIFCGEMELSGENVYPEIEKLKSILDQGITKLNWENVNKIIFQLYENVFWNCEPLYSEIKNITSRKLEEKIIGRK